MYLSLVVFFVVFFKQKTAYEMRISDWSSDVCSSDLSGRILAVDMTYAARCGWSADLSGPVTDRTLFHADNRSEEHTSELQSLMRISYAVFCLKKKKTEQKTIRNIINIRGLTQRNI